MDVLIDGVGMIPQFAAAISAIQNVRKKVLFAVFRFRRAAFCVAQECLYGFKIFAVYNRLVDIFEHHIIFRIVVDALAVFEGFGGGLEIDDVAAIFLPSQDLGDRGAFPLVRVRLGFLASSSNTLGLPISGAVQMPVFLQYAGNGVDTFSGKVKTKDFSNHLSGGQSAPCG